MKQQQYVNTFESLRIDQIPFSTPDFRARRGAKNYLAGKKGKTGVLEVEKRVLGPKHRRRDGEYTGEGTAIVDEEQVKNFTIQLDRLHLPAANFNERPIQKPAYTPYRSIIKIYLRYLTANPQCQG
ncbi:hypothetical protein HPP92_000358 [Vanilla planifolia]|uniref:Uncharacterized protein n=1 Tax=Vanilla planifolia TaxID=51239 RepID=A0A835RXW7_VANPL|nr:hypothetical protein HPP92_000358 [Vanilla planifolia]